jgi:hypothetical protein
MHEEVLAMQRRYGITYKDAAHRLFLMEVATVQQTHSAMSALDNIQDRIRRVVEMGISNPIAQIDRTDAIDLNLKPAATMPLKGRVAKKNKVDTVSTTGE